MGKTVAGTYMYMAPEVISSVPYSFEADIWSLGIILYKLCTLKHPFETVLDGNLLKYYRAMFNGNIDPLPEQFEQLSVLVSHMFKKNPKERPSISLILSFPIIKNMVLELLAEDEYKLEFE